MKEKYEYFLEKAKFNSIGVDKKTELKTGIKNISKKAIAVLLATMLSISVTSCNIYNKNEIYSKSINEATIELDELPSISQADYDFEYKDISSLRSEKVSIARANLHIYDIYYCDKDGRILSNDVDTYRKIVGLNEEDLIGYYLILGKKESEKIVMALGYQSWDSFLIENGFVNEKGIPEIDMWEYNVYENMQKEVERSLSK